MRGRCKTDCASERWINHKIEFYFPTKIKVGGANMILRFKNRKKEIKCRSKNKESIMTLTHTNALRGKRDRLLVEGVGWEKQLPESIDCYIGHWKNGGSEDILFRSSPLKTGLVLIILLIKWGEVWSKMMSWSEKIFIIFNYLIVHSSSAMQLSIEWMIFFSQYFLMLIHQWWFR